MMMMLMMMEEELDCVDAAMLVDCFIALVAITAC